MDPVPPTGRWRPEQTAGYFFDLLSAGELAEAKSLWDRALKRFADHTAHEPVLTDGIEVRSDNHWPMAWAAGLASSIFAGSAREPYRSGLLWWCKSQFLGPERGGVGLGGSEVGSGYQSVAVLACLVEALHQELRTWRPDVEMIWWLRWVVSSHLAILELCRVDRPLATWTSPASWCFVPSCRVGWTGAPQSWALALADGLGGDDTGEVSRHWWWPLRVLRRRQRLLEALRPATGEEAAAWAKGISLRAGLTVVRYESGAFAAWFDRVTHRAGGWRMAVALEPGKPLRALEASMTRNAALWRRLRFVEQREGALADPARGELLLDLPARPEASRTVVR